MRIKRKQKVAGSPATTPEPTLIGIPLYDGFDSLDVAGAFQVFYMLESENVKPVLIGPARDKVVTSFEGMRWYPDYGYNDHPHLDVVYVPGGAGESFESLALQDNGPFYKFLRQACDKADLVCAVCTGALFLARIGALDGYNCTTHWAYKPILSLFDKVLVAPGYPRYVIDRNRITGGGISSTIDEALAIAAILRGEEAAKSAQLTIQYAPDPPFHCGDPDQADPVTLQSVSSGMDVTPFYKSMEKSLRPKGR